MALMQLNFDLKNKIETAISLIQVHEPVEGYQVCLSAGGKDSEVVEHLAKMAGVKYDLVYSLTGIDPPEAVKFMREHYPQVIISKSEMSIWRWIEKKGLPTRQHRWCCEKLKEYSGAGRTLITGIRADESSARKRRGVFEPNRRSQKTFLNPIFTWSEMEVWEYIETNHLPYCHLYDISGWDRLGCILCPMTSWQRSLFEWARYPKLADAWFRATARYHERIYPKWKEKGLYSAERFKTPESLIWWWLTRGQTTEREVEYKAQQMGLTIKVN